MRKLQGGGGVGGGGGGVGAMISGIGLSGSDSKDKESNLLWVSREAVVSNNDVEKFGISYIPIQNFYLNAIHSGWHFLTVYVIPDIASNTTNPSVHPSNISITYTTWEVWGAIKGVRTWIWFDVPAIATQDKE